MFYLIIANIEYYYVFIFVNLIDEKYPIISIFNPFFTELKKGNLMFLFSSL